MTFFIPNKADNYVLGSQIKEQFWFRIDFSIYLFWIQPSSYLEGGAAGLNLKKFGEIVFAII